jgi:hypothetical protein
MKTCVKALREGESPTAERNLRTKGVLYQHNKRGKDLGSDAWQ